MKQALITAVMIVGLLGKWCAAEVQNPWLVEAGGGVSFPEDDSSLSYSPSAQVGAYRMLNESIGVGLLGGIDFDYDQSEQDTSETVTTTDSVTHMTVVTHKYHHCHYKKIVTVDTTNNTINTTLEQVRDPSEQRTMFLEPSIRVGKCFECLYPYARLGVGVGHITTHDDNDYFGVSTTIGVGLMLPVVIVKNLVFEVEASEGGIYVGPTVYSNVRLLALVGYRF